MSEAVSGALAPEMDKLEAIRRKLRLKGQLAAWLGCLIGLVGFGVAHIYLIDGDGRFADFPAFLFGLGPPVAGLTFKSALGRKWDQTVAQHVVKRITARIGPMTYLPEANTRFRIKEVPNAPMYPAFTGSNARHFLSGSHRGVKYRLATIDLVKTRGKRVETVWHGLVAAIAVPVPSPGVIWIGRDYRGKFKKLTGLLKAQPTVLEEVPGTYPGALEVRAEQPDAVPDYLPPGFWDVVETILAEEGSGAPAFGMVFDGDTMWLSLRGDHDFLGVIDISVPMSSVQHRLPDVIRDLTLPHRIIDRLAGDDV